jgi:hypothetical protein
MKKLYKKIFVFLLPIGLMLVVMPASPRLKYQGLMDDCSDRGAWIYQRLYENPEEIDVLFLGSSHTMNAIEDVLLMKNSQVGLNIVNMGYCRLGRDLHYELLNETLDKKNPQHVVIEIRRSENRYSHPIFPYIASTKDVIMAELFFNRDYISNLWKHFVYKIDVAQTYLYHDTSLFSGDLKNSGFPPWRDSTRFEVPTQAKAKAKYLESPWEHKFHLSFSKSYLNKISQLCKDHNIKLHFLYLPSFSMTTSPPDEELLYKKYGDVLIPPDSLLTNSMLWSDRNHFNYIGANELTRWLGQSLKISK